MASETPTPYFFKNVPYTRALFHLFSYFQTNITIFIANKCENFPSSIRCWDSNPQPSEHESPPITTRPGLPRLFYLNIFVNFSVEEDEEQERDEAEDQKPCPVAVVDGIVGIGAQPEKD